MAWKREIVSKWEAMSVASIMLTIALRISCCCCLRGRGAGCGYTRRDHGETCMGSRQGLHAASRLEVGSGWGLGGV